MLNQADKGLAKLERSNSYQYLLLAAIVLLAGVLRFYKLGEWSFWGDEYITVRRTLSLFDDGFQIRKFSLLAAHLSLNVFGVSEWSARLAASVIGILTLPVLFILVRRIFDPVTALLSSFLLAVSPWHIYWSQNARFYTALLLFFTLALLFFYLGIEEDRPWYLVFALGMLVLALAERLLAAFLVPIAVGYVFLLKFLPFAKPPGLRLRNMVLFFGPGLIGAVFIAFTVPVLQSPGLYLNAFGFVNNNPFWILGGVVFYIGIPLVCMGAFGAIYLLLQKNRAALLLSLAAIIPLLAILVISLFQYTANRYVFVSLTSVVVLAAVAAKELWWQLTGRTKFLGVGVLLILLLAPMGDNLLYYRYQNGNRDDWKGAFAFIASEKEEGDIVVTTHRELADYYMQEETVRMQNVDVDYILESQNRIWFVLDLTVPAKAPKISKWVKENAWQVADLDVTVSARTFPMGVYLFDPVQASTRVGVVETDP